jgi:biotin transport system substrate-specific component
MSDAVGDKKASDAGASEERPGAPVPAPPPRALRPAVLGLMAAATAVSAQLVIPFWPVPFTLQTAVTALAGLILPPVEACGAMLVYLGMGAVGLPVFAGLKGGIGVFEAPTGGFLVSFPLQAALTSWVSRRRGGMGLWDHMLAVLAGMVVVYGLGGAWLGYKLGRGAAAVGAILAPFLPGALVKAAFTAELYRRLAGRLPPPYRRG